MKTEYIPNLLICRINSLEGNDLWCTLIDYRCFLVCRLALLDGKIICTPVAYRTGQVVIDEDDEQCETRTTRDTAIAAAKRLGDQFYVAIELKLAFGFDILLIPDFLHCKTCPFIRVV